MTINKKRKELNGMLNKKRLILSILLIVVFGLFYAGCSNPDVSLKEDDKEDSKVYELDFAGFFPPGSPFEENIMPVLMKEIETATNGRVKIVSYPGGSLLEGGKIFDGVREGAADMGHEALSWLGERLPLNYLFQMPGVPFTSAKSASYALTEAMEILKPKELADVKILMLIATGPGHIISTVPIRNLEDLKGKEIRVIEAQASAIQALGASPIYMSHAESYEAFAKNVVQGNLAALEVLKSYKLAEVSDYVTVTDFLYNGIQAIVMNLDVWNSLPKDIQDGIESACEKVWDQYLTGYYDDGAIGALKWAQETGKQEVIHLSPEEEAKWKEKISFVLDDYAKKLDERGLPGTQTKELIFELGEKYNKIYPAQIIK